MISLPRKAHQRRLGAIPGRPIRLPPTLTPLELEPGEETVLDGTGALISGRHGRPRLGRLLLTTRRLLLVAATGVKQEIPLDQIEDLAIERRYFLLRMRDTVVLTRKAATDGSPPPGRVLVLVDRAERWRKTIFELTKLELTASDVAMVAVELDPPSRVILEHVWIHEFARVEELARLYDAPSQMDVLLRIRKEINPVAERLTGYPILVFKASGRTRGGLGEVVPFAWWITGRAYGNPDTEYVIDVFDEGGHLDVVVDFLGVRSEDIRLNLTGDQVTLLIDAGRLVRREIPLPCRVVLDDSTTRLHNGILVAKLKKAPANTSVPPVDERGRPEAPQHTMGEHGS